MGQICMKYIKSEINEKLSRGSNVFVLNSCHQAIKKRKVKVNISTHRNVANTFVFLKVNQSFQYGTNGVIQ
jgi:hypothetical protein